METEYYDVDVLGERVIAQLIDGIIMVVIAAAFLAGSFAILGVGEEAGAASGVFGGIGVGAFFMAFLVGFAYNAGLEHYWNGQTLGKRAMGIRVVGSDGEDAGVGQVAIRNIPAVVNLGLFSIIAALLAMAVSDRNQRIFDSLASTVVVKEGSASRGTEQTQDQFQSATQF